MLDRLQDDAYKAGLKPLEFFDLTPGEVSRWLGPRWRGLVMRTYYDEGVRRRRTLPQSVDDLFPKKANDEVLNDDQMLVRLKAIAKESKKAAAAAKAPRATEVRK
jgi:hypothetical protein